MLIISASEAKKISDSLHESYLYQLKINLMNSILDSAGRGDKFANEYIEKQITSTEIKNLIVEFQSKGYEVKLTYISNQIIFSIRW